MTTRRLAPLRGRVYHDLSGRDHEEWRDHAACRNHRDPDLFFPVGETGPGSVQAEDAKAVCSGCPVAEECLEWALAMRAEGVWGGTTTDERRLIFRRRRDREARRQAS